MKERKLNKNTNFEDSIKRLFSLIPLIYQNQGIHLEELQKRAGYDSRKALLEDIDRLLLVGHPPFSPSDFISTRVVEGERVYLDFPQGMERPPDLSSAEWLALTKLIEWKLGFQKGGEKSKEHLAEVLQKVSSIPLAFSNADPFQASKTLLKEALAEELQVTFLYRSLSSKEPEVRRVDPWAVFDHNLQSYLIGHCHTRRDVRIFSLIRMEDLSLLGEPVEEPCPANVQQRILRSPIFKDEPSGTSVSLGFAPGLRRLGSLLFGIDEWKKQEELSAELHPLLPETFFWAKTKIPSKIWLYEVLLGLGPQAVILAPAFMRDEFREKLKERISNM